MAPGATIHVERDFVRDVNVGHHDPVVWHSAQYVVVDAQDYETGNQIPRPQVESLLLLAPFIHVLLVVCYVLQSYIHILYRIP